MDLDTTLDELAPALLRYCRGRSGDPGLAEDTAQEALMALVDRWRRLGPPDSPSAFAFTVARRRLGRRLMARRLWAPLEALGTGPRPGADPQDPGDRLEIREELRATADAVKRLRPKLRDALLLVSAGGLDTTAASQVLGISPSALKMRVARARAQLLDNLHEVGYDH